LKETNDLAAGNKVLTKAAVQCSKEYNVDNETSSLLKLNLEDIRFGRF
jgi:hypothetical protein